MCLRLNPFSAKAIAPSRPFVSLGTITIRLTSPKLLKPHPFQTLRPSDARDVLVERSPEAQRPQPSQKHDSLNGYVKSEAEIELEEGLGPLHLDHGLIEEHLVGTKEKHDIFSTTRAFVPTRTYVPR